MAIRNLTHERQLAYLKTRKAQELSLVGAHETVNETVAKPGPKKNDPVEYVERRVSKRDFLAREHDERITRFAASVGLAV